MLQRKILYPTLEKIYNMQEEYNQRTGQSVKTLTYWIYNDSRIMNTKVQIHQSICLKKRENTMDQLLLNKRI